MKGVFPGLAFGLVLGCAVVACARPLEAPEWQRRQQKMTEITTLWAQIRGWRHEAHMDLDPEPSTMHQWSGRSVPEAARVCSQSVRQPKRCDDICSIGEAICDNAERICTLADELGNDQLAQDKCTSAKASCREAKQRCCTCIAAPDPVEAGP